MVYQSGPSLEHRSASSSCCRRSAAGVPLFLVAWPAELGHELRSLPIALPGIPTPTLDNPEVVIEDDLREFVGRVTPPGDVQQRVLDPHASDVAAIDQLRIHDVFF